jgi:hypothetical protein
MSFYIYENWRAEKKAVIIEASVVIAITEKGPVET